MAIGNIETFLVRYWYVFLILFLTIFYFAIWKSLDAYTKRRVINLFSGVKLFVILIVIIWVFWHRYGRTISVKQSDPLMLFVILIFSIIYLGLYNVRYHSKQVLTPTLHGSYFQRHEKNGFYIFGVGSLSYGVQLELPQELLILRKETVADMREGGSISIARPFPVSIYDLPRSVREYILGVPALKRASNRISYGWFDDINQVEWTKEQLATLAEDHDDKIIYNFLKKQLGVQNPTIKLLFQMWLDSCKEANKTGEVLDSVVEVVEKGVEHDRRVKERYQIRETPETYDSGEES